MCQNFIKLCTEPGGYIGTKFFSMTSDKMVLGGDNETNDGTGGTSGFQGQKTIVADQGDLKDCRGALRMTFVEKTSDGRVHVASQFRVLVRK
jgi:cyclophilin family peptidyl-prolyl cis-trans isomerase